MKQVHRDALALLAIAACSIAATYIGFALACVAVTLVEWLFG